MITLTTIVYDGNIDRVLAPDSYFSTYKGKKLLVVNNLTKEINTEFETLNVNDHKEEAKKFFKLDIGENTKGYWYTIPYFVMLLKIKGHILNVSSDCKVSFEDDFIKDSIEELKNPDVLSTTLEWLPDVGKHEAVKESDKFYYSKGFSDQVFIADVDKLRNVDYNTTYDFDYYGLGANGEVFHGGNSFEKRLATYMRKEGKFRGIYKKYNYTHE